MSVIFIVSVFGKYSSSAWYLLFKAQTYRMDEHFRGIFLIVREHAAKAGQSENLIKMHMAFFLKEVRTVKRVAAS